MRLSRTLVPAALALGVLAAPIAHAATVKTNTYVLKDTVGDANGLNDQGTLPVGGDGTAGPGSDASKDIVSLTYKGTKKGTACTGFTVDLRLSGAPSASTLYRVRGTAPVNSQLWWLQYDGTSSKLRFSDGSGGPVSSGTVPLTVPVKVIGSTLTFTVLEKDIKASGEKLKGFVISAPGSDIRTVTPAATVPQWDAVHAADASFKPCS
jgi:hypothetical protein